MEGLNRLVSESMARHGFDRPLDYRRLHWSRWFRCESHHSLLFVPSKSGVFAIAEEIMDLGPEVTTDASSVPPARSAADSVWDRASDPVRPSATRIDLAASTTAPGLRRMLAVTQFFEDDDMAFVLDRMLSSQNPMRARLVSGRYFVRFVVIEDQVQGRVVWQNENLDDLVLLRSDGTPTYMLAVVVDDHDMGVTHVIRGDDHLINAARQKQIYDALEWPLPSMSHIPLIHGPDGSKLSKRHGALGVDAYRALGYLPAALRNYLVRLGWSHGDQEIFSTEEMIAAFDLSGIGRSAARFDFAKLENLNGHYIRNSDDQSLVTMLEGVLDFVPQGADLKARLNATTRAQLLQAMPSLKERAKTLIELIDACYFIFADRPLVLEAKAAVLLTPETRELIGRLRQALETVMPWSVQTTEAAMRAFADANNLKLGAVAQPLRVALTGRTTSPGIFEVLAVLGREECLARLADQAG